MVCSCSTEPGGFEQWYVLKIPASKPQKRHGAPGAGWQSEEAQGWEQSSLPLVIHCDLRGTTENLFPSISSRSMFPSNAREAVHQHTMGRTTAGACCRASQPSSEQKSPQLAPTSARSNISASLFLNVTPRELLQGQQTELPGCRSAVGSQVRSCSFLLEKCKKQQSTGQRPTAGASCCWWEA